MSSSLLLTPTRIHCSLHRYCQRRVFSLVTTTQTRHEGYNNNLVAAWKKKSLYYYHKNTACLYFSSFSASSGRKKVAIVGSGPSGCYTAKYLIQQLSNNVQVDMIERLPTPYGLVRFGVAPDHPEVKNVQSDFDTLFEETTTSNDESSSAPLVQFYGNVQVGTDVTIQELRQLYDAVVLCYGCESDRKLHLNHSLKHIDGSTATDRDNYQLKGIISAREFVAWYNGHPDFRHIGEQVKEALCCDNDNDNPVQEIVIIGQGNVALDCARILAKTKTELQDTDITNDALQLLNETWSMKNDNIDNENNKSVGPKRIIHVLGRRGHVQGAYTIKELRELTKLENAQLIVRNDELDLGSNDVSLQELKASRPKTRIDKLLRSVAIEPQQQDNETTTTNNNNNNNDCDTMSRIHLRFLLNPISWVSQQQDNDDNSDQSKLGKVVCERTKLVVSQSDESTQYAVGTGEYETIPAQLALVSIGYKGIAIPGTEEWYDDTSGTLKNVHGKVQDATMTTLDNNNNDDTTLLLLGGVYVSGWLKRGPSGIIGTNIPDAKDTVATIVQDLSTATTTTDKSTTTTTTSLLDLLQSRNVQVVNWNGYQKINNMETSIDTKRSEVQPREKITNRETLLQVAALK